MGYTQLILHSLFINVQKNIFSITVIVSRQCYWAFKGSFYRNNQRIFIWPTDFTCDYFRRQEKQKINASKNIVFPLDNKYEIHVQKDMTKEWYVESVHVCVCYFVLAQR